MWAPNNLQLVFWRDGTDLIPSISIRNTGLDIGVRIRFNFPTEIGLKNCKHACSLTATYRKQKWGSHDGSLFSLAYASELSYQLQFTLLHAKERKKQNYRVQCMFSNCWSFWTQENICKIDVFRLVNSNIFMGPCTF